jgi:predicted  nucleic acid-binding Zn-ribbon protein
MTWECTECGEIVGRQRPPARCPECGTASTFVRADETEPADHGDGFRAAWIRAGMQRGFLRAT